MNHVPDHKAGFGAVAQEPAAEKALTKITINDIAEDCGINRMTFYHPSFPFPLYDDWAGGIKTICVIAGYNIKFDGVWLPFHPIIPAKNRYNRV